MAELQCITTAPRNPAGRRDGPKILVHGTLRRVGEPYIGRPTWYVAYWSFEDGMGWRACLGDNREPTWVNATDWMPLPEAPPKRDYSKPCPCGCDDRIIPAAPSTPTTTS